MSWKTFFAPKSAPADLMYPETLVTTPDDVRSSYERGRRDGRREQKRHPIGMTVLFLAAAVGVCVLGYAIYEGSFALGGKSLDRDITVAAAKATPVVQDAAQKTADTLKRDPH